MSSFLIANDVDSERSSNHPLYISTIELKENFLLVKVFKEDLTNAIRNGFDEYKQAKGVEFFLSNQDLMETYFQAHLQVRINEKFIGFTIERVNVVGDTFWLAFSINTPLIWKTLQIEANYFMELFPSQINILKTFYKGQIQHCKFIFNSERCTLNFTS